MTKYSLTSKLLGKKVYPNKINKMYESLVAPRDGKSPKWIQTQKAILDAVRDFDMASSYGFASEEQLDALDKTPEINKKIDAAYKEAKDIHNFLNQVPAGALANPDEVKSKIERYVKLSKDIRRNMLRLIDAAGDSDWKEFTDNKNFGIEPVQDFLDTERIQTGRSRQVPGGQAGEMETPRQEPKKRFDQQITSPDGETLSLQDYLVDAIKDAGVTAGEKAGRFGKDAKTRPPTLKGKKGGLPEDNVSAFADPKLGNATRPKPFKFKVNGAKGAPVSYTAKLMGTSYGDIESGTSSKLAAAAKSLTRVDFVLNNPADVSSVTMTDFSEAMAALAVNGTAAKNKNLSPGDKKGAEKNSQGEFFVQGPSKTFDVLAANGTKWECKQIKSFNPPKKGTPKPNIGDGVADKEKSGGSARLGLGAQQMTARAQTKFGTLVGDPNSVQSAAGLVNLKDRITQVGNDLVDVLINSKGGNTPDKAEKNVYSSQQRRYADGLWYAQTGGAKTFIQAVGERELSGALGEYSRVPYLLTDIIFETGQYLQSISTNLKKSVVDYVESNPTIFQVTSGIASSSERPNPKTGEVEKRIYPGRKRSRANFVDAQHVATNILPLPTFAEEDILVNILNVLAVCQATPVLFKLVFKKFLDDAAMPTIVEAERAVKNMISELFPGNFYSITTTNAAGEQSTENISSNDQNADLMKEYLGAEYEGFIFTVVDSTKKRFSIYVVHKKAAIYWASKGAIKFRGPSSGAYKIEFSPPETSDQKYLTNPLARLKDLQGQQLLDRQNETYSVFNGGSPGRTLNEWVKWATK